MAKKKRKRRPQNRPQSRPQTTTATAAPERAAAASSSVRTDAGPSNRQLRKEQARIERERRLRQARRRMRTRRLLRWGVPLLLIAAVVTFFVWRNVQQRRELEQAAAAFGCGEVELKQDEIDTAEARGAASPPTIHAEPYAAGQNGIPATAGSHTANTMPEEPQVYDQPIPEETVMHNLEHGYVVVWYAAEGENALSDDLRSSIEGVVDEEAEVLMAPYDGLAQPVALVSWGRLQVCSPPENADAGDAEAVVRGFIEEFRNSDLAPEASA